MIRWQYEHEDAQFDKQGNCHLLVDAKRTRQPRGCCVRFALTSRWQLPCLSNWASSCSCCQRIISLAFYANVSNKELYTASKEVQDLLRMAKGKTIWEGASKIGNSYLPGGSPNQKMDSQLHAIELLGNTGSRFEYQVVRFLG